MRTALHNVEKARRDMWTANEQYQAILKTLRTMRGEIHEVPDASLSN